MEISQEKLIKLVSECTKRVLMENRLLTEMAIPRKDFVLNAYNQSNTALIHIGKVCALENNPNFSACVRHWLNEVATQVYDFAKVSVSKDNADCTKKKHAFVQGFIEYRLGEDFCEYDNNMNGYIMEGLEDEGLTDDEIRNYDLQAIAMGNKERIINYLYSFVPLLSIKGNSALKLAIKEQAQKF